jgi:hypothetical protein
MHVCVCVHLCLYRLSRPLALLTQTCSCPTYAPRLTPLLLPPPLIHYLPPFSPPSHTFHTPRQLFEYDQVVNTQRDKVYSDRRRAVLSSGLAPLMIEYAEKTMDDILEVRSDRGGG